jgi:parvulin-like peptidyl-prolyl isomerase
MRPIRLLLAPLALATLAASCGNDSPAVPASAIAVVGDRTITRAQLAAAMAQARQSYAARRRAFPAVGTSGYEALERLAVRVLVEQAELEQEAPRLGVAIDPSQVEARMRQMKEQSFGGSEQRYRARLRAAGMTDAQVRAAVRAQLLVAAIRQAVTADVTVGAQAVQDYYEQHLDDYSTPARRAIRHILVRTKALAEQVAARLAAGASFAALALQFSVDTRTRVVGGRLTLVRGQNLPGLDRVGFSLRTGASSRPFRTRFGWEIVQAVAPVSPSRTTPLVMVRDGIRRRLLGVRRNQAFNRWLDQVRAKYVHRTAFADGFSPIDGS